MADNPRRRGLAHLPPQSTSDPKDDMFSELPQLDGGDFEDIEESVLGLFLVDRSPSPTPSTSPDASGSPLPPPSPPPPSSHHQFPQPLTPLPHPNSLQHYQPYHCPLPFRVGTISNAEYVNCFYTTTATLLTSTTTTLKK